MSRLRHAGLVFLFFLCATALFTYPLLFNLKRAALIGFGDYLDESARIAWNAHQLLTNPLRLFVTSVKDGASGQLTEEGVEALRAVGGREDIRGRLWVSHLLIGVKGAKLR